MNKNLEKLLIIIGNRYPRFWFDLFLIERENPNNVKKCALEIIDKCFLEFNEKDKRTINKLLREGV